jgi:hypothetical protein
MADPFTGLAYPQRIESAELTYKEGLPIGKLGLADGYNSSAN